MSTVFVIQNQNGDFLDKHGEWTNADDASHIFKSPHKDLAVNQLFEATSKDMMTRAKVVEASLDERGLPAVKALPALDFPKVALPDEMAQDDDQAEDKAPEQISIETAETDPTL